MASFSSPMQPIAPPTKKMKAGIEKEGIDLDSVDAVKKRRDELNRLRQKQLMRTTEKTTPGGSKVRVTSSQGLLAQARSQLDGISLAPAGHQVSPPAPPAPPVAPLGRVRHSDIFPSVVEKAPPRSTEAGRSSRAPPPPSSRPTQVPNRKVEPVVRRLDQSFDRGKSPASRAKSAPPVRPPPPPGPPPSVKEAPASTYSRAFKARPPPLAPATKPKDVPGESELPAVQLSKDLPPPISTPKAPTFPNDQTMLSSVSDAPKTEPKVSAPPVSPQIRKVSLPSFDLPKSPQVPLEPPTQVPPDTELLPKSRKDLIQNLYQYAETPGKRAEGKTPSSQKHESSLLRLEKEVREHDKAKAEALRRVALLEDQLQKLKEKGDPEEELGALVLMADKEGDGVALQWARDRISGVTPKASAAQVGFFSPLSPGLATPRANHRKRAPTPHPKRAQQGTGSVSAEGELEVRNLFSESVKYTPFEYSTDLATFVVRRPYGIAKERELWFKAGYLNTKQYEKLADVQNQSTLEIIAQINADGSIMALHGGSIVRHIGADFDADWKEFGSVDETDKPLGSITYIDRDANERDYSLDEIYEGAMAARENYCTSVIAMVAALKDKNRINGRKGVPRNLESDPAVAPITVKPHTCEVGVGTEDLPFSVPGTEKSTHDQDLSDGKKDQSPPKPTPIGEEADGPETASVLLGTMVSLLCWLLRTVLITAPLKILSFTFFSFISFVVLAIVTLQLAEDNGATNMGAGIDRMFNRPGIV